MKKKNSVKSPQKKPKGNIPAKNEKKGSPAKKVQAKGEVASKRTPVRKIVLKDTGTETESISPVNKSDPQVLKKLERALPTQPAKQRYAWNALPSAVPVRVRFMIRLASSECSAAAAWPFSFAKFLSALPTAVCGLDFALLLMSQDLSEQDLARICRMPLEEIRAALSRINVEIEELFSAKCNEIFRKWWRSSAATSLLLEPYHIAKVDKDFQLTIADVVLHSMRRNASPQRAANN